jgi:toxin ParE1/3/4
MRTKASGFGPYGNYLIFYRIDQDRILIADIIHGARDYEAVLLRPR